MATSPNLDQISWNFQKSSQSGLTLKSSKLCWDPKLKWLLMSSKTRKGEFFWPFLDHKKCCHMRLSWEFAATSSTWVPSYSIWKLFNLLCLTELIPPFVPNQGILRNKSNGHLLDFNHSKSRYVFQIFPKEVCVSPFSKTARLKPITLINRHDKFHSKTWYQVFTMISSLGGKFGIKHF